STECTSPRTAASATHDHPGIDETAAAPCGELYADSPVATATSLATTSPPAMAASAGRYDAGIAAGAATRDHRTETAGATAASPIGAAASISAVTARECLGT